MMRTSARSAARGIIAFLAALPLALAALVACSDAPRAAEGWPASMRAVYDVNFNGFNVGTFVFQSQAERQSYTLSANARLSVLLGAFTWDGETRSFGLIAKEAPKPASFTFDFKSSLKAGSMKVGFADGAVNKITHLP